MASKSRGRYNPSKPYEYPHKDKGTLRKSIGYEVNKQKKSVKISASAEHGLFLEKGTRKMEPRPFVSRTIREEQKVIIDIFKGKVT